jgi:hypothetical protein
MNKHTPGPWTLKHVQGSNFAVQEFDIRGVFAGHAGVAPIFNRSRHAIDGATIYTSPEDARLIATAPDFYSAALKFKEHQAAFDNGDDVAAMLHYADFVRMLDEALAKATGG